MVRPLQFVCSSSGLEWQGSAMKNCHLYADGFGGYVPGNFSREIVNFNSGTSSQKARTSIMVGRIYGVSSLTVL